MRGTTCARSATNFAYGTRLGSRRWTVIDVTAERVSTPASVVSTGRNEPAAKACCTPWPVAGVPSPKPHAQLANAHCDVRGRVCRLPRVGREPLLVAGMQKRDPHRLEDVDEHEHPERELCRAPERPRPPNRVQAPGQAADRDDQREEDQLLDDRAGEE